MATRSLADDEYVSLAEGLTEGELVPFGCRHDGAIPSQVTRPMDEGHTDEKTLRLYETAVL